MTYKNNTPLRPRSHITGDVGQTEVALQFKKWGWTADTIASDYGEDLSCDIFTNGRKTAYHFRCQVKSTLTQKGKIKKLKSNKYSIQIDSTTCTSWGLSYFPIILAIYIESEEKIFWVNATQQVRENLEKLSKKQITIYVGSKELKNSQNELEETISLFYSNLLQISHPSYFCEVYPIIMPSYRAPSIDIIIKNNKLNKDDNLKFHSIFKKLESLPSWFLSINTLNAEHLGGWEVSSTIFEINTFIDNLQKKLLSFKTKIKKGEWLSFIVSPIKLNGSNNSESSFWNKEITDWWSFSIINKEIIVDKNYSFDPPEYYILPIARRSRSWSGYWIVNNELNLAINIYSSIPLTLAYRQYDETLNKQILNQFIPWECKVKELSILGNKLLKIGLQLLTLTEISLSKTDEDWIQCIICDPMFSPSLGLFSPTQNWDEFEDNKVNFKLKKKKLYNKLPGKLGPESIIKFILLQFGRSQDLAINKTYIEANDYTNGLPLNHNERKICFYRYIKSSYDTDNISKSWLKLQENKVMQNLNENIISSNIYIDSYNNIENNICYICIDIIPKESISTANFISTYEKKIATILDDFNDSFKDIYPDSTLDILKFDGEIYFSNEDYTR